MGQVGAAAGGNRVRGGAWGMRAMVAVCLAALCSASALRLRRLPLPRSLRWTPAALPLASSSPRLSICARIRLKQRLTEAQARKLAREVASGCAGAASRFARVMDLLLDAGLGGADSAREGALFARRTEMETAAFVSIFQHAYLEEYLDLDLDASLKLASSLTVNFDSDILGAREDFERLVEFCVQTKELDLPRPECGRFALRIAKLGQPWSGGISGPFLTIFKFATAPDGVAIPTGRALQLAEQLVHQGPSSAENFTLGYKYAVSPKGLNLTPGDALKFATGLAEAR